MTTIPNEVLSILKRSRAEGNTLYLPAEQFDRDLYLKIDKVLKAIGSKWNRKAKGHVFERGIPAELLADATANGAYVDRKKEFGFFETPTALATRMVSLAELKPGDSVLEPSAGRGRIVEAIPTHVALTVVEVDPQNVAVLRAVAGRRVRVIEGDFLTTKHLGLFDVVIMNPPFANNADINHVAAAASYLRPSGRLVAIMSPHFTFASDSLSVYFRDWIDRHGTWEKLPEGTFKESGTGTNAVLVVARIPD